MKYLSLLIALMLLSPRLLWAQSADSLPQREQTTDKQQWSPLFRLGVAQAAPLVGIGLLQTIHNEQIRELRHGYYPRFRHHYDDYMQFAPLAVQLGLRLGGLEGTSRNIGQMLSADALAALSMMAITTGIKYTARIERPDGSTRNSFPSGHTAMAFTSAALLSIEYGERYPWLPIVSYGSAALAGVGRILNNRHWIGDVVTGAGIGIFCGHLGYWLTDKLFGNPSRTIPYYGYSSESRLRLYIPITLSSSTERGDREWNLRGRHVGLGLQYTLPRLPLDLKGRIDLSLYRPIPEPALVPAIEPTRSIDLRLGLGHSFRLWTNLGFSASIHGLLRHTTSSTARQGTLRLSSSADLYGLGLELSPTWRLSRMVGLRLPLGIDYIGSRTYLLQPGAPSLRMSPWEFSTGTALEIYL